MFNPKTPKRCFRGTRKFLTTVDETIDRMCIESKEMISSYQNNAIKSNLQSHLMQYFENINVHLYGSRIIGLATKESDLDIFIEIDENFYAEKDLERDRILIRKLEKALRCNNSWSVKICIDGASVPIVKAAYGSIECDFSVSNGIGIKNSLIIRHLFEIQPEAIRFYHFMKIFLPRYDKNFEGYLLKLLVIFFLQSENLMPSIEVVQKDTKVEKIGVWEVQVDDKRTLNYYGLKKMKDYHWYIPSFFKFYSVFKYSKFVMSIYHGHPIARKEYKYKKEVLKEHVMCIFGPINQEHNIGKYVARNVVSSFTGTCCGLYFGGFLKNHEWNKMYELYAKII